MKVATIADIPKLADGTVIGQIKVTVKAAFPPNTGDGKYGPWRVQSCILKDATGEVRGSFWTDDDMQQLVGKVITIKSQATAKGLMGLTVQESKRNKVNELKITDKAGIYEGDAAPAVEEYVQAQAQALPQAKSPHAAAATNPQTARKRLFQQAQLYSECIKAALYIREQHKLSDDHFQAAVASMYISADRAGLFACFPDSAAKPAAAPSVDDIPMAHESDEFAQEVGW